MEKDTGPDQLRSNLLWSFVKTEAVATQWPQTRCSVLVDDVRQQQVTQAAGADSVLIKGFTPAEFIEAVEELLSRGKTDDDGQSSEPREEPTKKESLP